MAKKKNAQGKARVAPVTSVPSDAKQGEPGEHSQLRAGEGGFPVVGIGASAGGFESLRRLLQAMPDQPGLAFVVIPHLEPTKKSLHAALLAKYTKMNVAQVEGDLQVRPNCVYIMPPDKYLSIAGGVLRLSEPDRPHGVRMAVDFFLRSLARDQQQCAVSVILSGNGTDGTGGSKAIKAAGGLVIAQDLTTAECDSMPRSAIGAGVVDHVLPPAEIPEALVRYASPPYVREGKEELQSTNDELETNKEHLPSLNEELSTVNQQLAAKVTELENRNADLYNLLAATDVATICLDATLAILWFTPTVRQVIPLRDVDKGRPLADFTQDLMIHDLIEAVHRVLETRAPLEDESRCSDGRVFLRRITPCHSDDRRSGGVVITFIDISDRKQCESDVVAARDMAEKIVDTVRESMLVLDPELRVVSANESFYRTFQVSPQDTEGTLVYQLGNNQWDIPQLRQQLEEVLPQQKAFSNFEVDHLFETIGRKVMLLNARKIDHIERILLAIQDITEHRFAEGRRAFLLELTDVFRECREAAEIPQRMTIRLGQFLRCHCAVYAELKVTEEGITILSQHAAAGDDAGTVYHLTDCGNELLSALLEHDQLIIADLQRDVTFGPHATRRIIERLGIRSLLCLATRPAETRVALVVVGYSSPHPWYAEEIALVRDVVERTWLAQDVASTVASLRESEERLRRAAEATGFGTYDHDVAAGRSIWSPELYAITGVAATVTPDTDLMKQLVHPEDREDFERGRQLALAAPIDTRHEIEFRIVRSDGTVRWVRDTGQSVFTGAGNTRRAVRVVGTVQDITQRKLVEEALRDRERHFRSMADELPLMVWLHNAEGRQEFVNKTLCEYFGLRRQQLRGDFWQSLIHPEDAAYTQEFVDCVLARRPFHSQARVKRADGQWRWIESWAQPRIDSHGEYLGHIGGSADVTERKQAEIERDKLTATLEQQVKHRTQVLELLQDVTRSANEASTVEDALRAALTRIAQYNDWSVGHVWVLADDGSGDMVSSRLWHETTQDHETTIQLDRFKQFCESIRLSSGECMVGGVMESHTPQWIDNIQDFNRWTWEASEDFGLHAAFAFPITINDGELVAVMEFFSDRPVRREEGLMAIIPDVGIQLGHVFKRKRVEMSLNVSEKRRRAILNAAPDAIISTNPQGLITDANPAAVRIFGYPLEELAGLNIRELVPSSFHVEPHTDNLRALMASPLEDSGLGREVVARRKEGRLVPIRININEIEQEGGFVGIVHDISQEKELEKQVVDAAAEEQRRIAGDIHDGVGQELTGLRYMAQTHAETLAAQSAPEAKTAQRMTEWLETVQTQLRHIIRELVPVEIDEYGLSNALRNLAERTSESHRLECTVTCNQTIDLTDATVATHLYRIAQEAVRNAVKHAQASRIHIQLLADENAILLQVDDDGVGFDASANKNIGFGLRSMAYRAGLIGANFTCRPGAGGGTQIACEVFRRQVVVNRA